MQLINSGRRVLALVSVVFAALLGGGAGALLGTCGPFTDTANDAFCPLILEVYYLAITTGTTPTTYDPASNVTRTQMAAFLSRTVDGVLKRGSRRAALNQFWALQTTTFFDVTTVGDLAGFPASDGLDVWVPNFTPGTVSRVRAGDGRVLETWTGAVFALGALSALGSIFVTGNTFPGSLYRIDPRMPAGVVTTVASNLGNDSYHLTFDGGRIWTTNSSSVSIVTPGLSTPWSVTTVTTGLAVPTGALFDGTNVWVTDSGPGTLLRLNSSGAVLQTVTVGSAPRAAVFDGANIWVPNASSNSVSVVRALNGVVLATLTGSGLSLPFQAAFDGERILVTNQGGGGSVSLWKAADLTAIGNLLTGGSAVFACSDGANFWFTLRGNQLARF